LPDSSSDPTLTVIQASSAPASSANPAAPAAKTVEPEAKVEPKSSVAVQIIEEWKGTESNVQEPRVVVIRKKEAWEKLWTEAAIPGPLPEVDFGRHLVMGVFAGARPAGSSVGMGKIIETDNGVYAPYHFTIAAVQVSSPTAQVFTHPYMFSMIPRVDKKIRLSQEEAPR
jgi:hypothetical protein